VASFLKRLFGKQAVALMPDVAGGDWTPIPVSATAQTSNVMGWLQEKPARLVCKADGEPVRPRRNTIRRMYRCLAGFIGVDDEGDTIDEHTGPTLASYAEEREDPTIPNARSALHGRNVLTGSEDPALPHRRGVSVCSHQPSPVLDNPSSSSKPRHVVDKVASRAGEDAFLGEGGGESWIDVLKQYGEHLTEEELKIVRRQLA
jgi:hypothetical protein